MMYKLNKLRICFLLSGMLVFLSVQSRAGKTEVENWTFLGGETAIGKLGFSFHNANFFSHQNGYFLNHTQLSLDFPSKSNFYLGIGYKQEYVQFPTYWRAEYRPMLHLYYKKQWGNLNFRDRSRWEFRFMDGQLINRYRNQVQLAFTKFENIKPYFSTEFSFYFNKLNYTRQRTILGAEIPIKKVSLNLFLGHQINEDFPEIWNTKIMLGTGASYSF